MICGWLVTGATLALGTVLPGGQWPLWEGYTSSFISEDGRVVDRQGGGGRTTSEGQSYALFFSLVANDRERFDRLLNWTSEHLAGGDLGSNLPAWLWGKAPDGRWKTLDVNSAADADLWIGYTLCEAGRLWHEPRYEHLGRRMMARIADLEVTKLPGFGAMLLPGAGGFQTAPDTWLLNPSYLPLPLLIRLADINPQGPWSGIAARLPLFLEKSARNGFVMDWVSYRARDGFQPAALPGGDGYAKGSYDAIRVYLWAGLTNPETAWSKQTLDAISGMATYLDSHAIPPEHVDATGIVAGGTAPVGFSAALLPYLEAMNANPALTAQTARVLAQRDPGTHLYGRPPSYYDENLCLFGLGSGHWFAFGRGGKLQVSWRRE